MESTRRKLHPYIEENNMQPTEMSPDVVEVIPNPDFTLTLIFENGEKKKFDMTPYLGCSTWFEELRDWNYFSQARPDLGTVVWTNGQDLCPDTFYLDSVSIE